MPLAPILGIFVTKYLWGGTGPATRAGSVTAALRCRSPRLYGV